jgi:hypothetical protein
MRPPLGKLGVDRFRFDTFGQWPDRNRTQSCNLLEDCAVSFGMLSGIVM